MLAAQAISNEAVADPVLDLLGTWIRDPRCYANLSAKRAPEIYLKLASMASYSDHQTRRALSLWSRGRNLNAMGQDGAGLGRPS